MIWALLIVCAAALLAQYRAQEHEITLRGRYNDLDALDSRISALEEAKSSQFDPKAFEDLKTKVEALRISQGLKGR